MFKKITSALLALIVSFSFVQAQDFELLLTNPAHDTTSGVQAFQSGNFNHDNTEIKNFVKNISNDTFAVTWRLLTVDSTLTDTYTQNHPDLWFPTGICDNINCRGEFGAWYFGASQQSNPIAPGKNGLLEIRVYAPISSPDTTRIYKIEIASPNQVDTGVYILTKIGSTGVSTVRLSNNHVAIYPNPVKTNQALHLFVDKNRQAQKAVVYNIIGQRQMTVPLGQKELTNIKVSQLTSGMYFLKVFNGKGQVMATRKFTKQ